VFFIFIFILLFLLEICEELFSVDSRGRWRYRYGSSRWAEL